MTKVRPITNESIKSESEEPREQHLSQAPIRSQSFGQKPNDNPIITPCFDGKT
jgi:hypothetical protein